MPKAMLASSGKAKWGHDSALSNLFTEREKNARFSQSTRATGSELGHASPGGWVAE